MSNPDRISARGFCGYDEVVNTPEDDGGGMEERSEIKGGIGKSPCGSDVGFCFRVVVLVEWRILYLDFPFTGVVARGGAGIGTGVADLEVSVEPDEEGGTLMVDMEKESNGFLAFAFNLASSCALAYLNLAVSGVSVLSLDSLDEDSAGDDGWERDREGERDGENTGVEGVLKR